jgi:hypothetical protein
MEPEPRTSAGIKDLHRIGGGWAEILRLKPLEATMDPPGISVLRAPKLADAAAQIRDTFPGATELHEAAKIIGSASLEAIRDTGFDVIAKPTRRPPNHHRIVHSEGASGFVDENLERLSKAFTDSSGY